MPGPMHWGRSALRGVPAVICWWLRQVRVHRPRRRKAGGLMALDLDAMFAGVGKFGNLLRLADAHAAALPAAIDSVLDLYTGYEDRLTTPPAIDASRGAVFVPYGYLPAFLQCAESYLLAAVAEDQPGAARTLGDALNEVVRQMVAQSKTVKRSIVSATTTPIGTISGDGIVTVTATNPKGLSCELAYAETGRLAATGDGGWVYVGAAGDPGETLRGTWPDGSDAVTNIEAVTPASGSLIANGDFLSGFTGTIPNGWALRAGTTLASATGYGDTQSVQLVDNITQLEQALPNQVGPYTTLLVNAWHRFTGTPSGLARVSLINGATGLVLLDDLGFSQRFTLGLTGLPTGTWLRFAGVLRVPRVRPVDLRVAFESTAAGGFTYLLDRVTVSPFVELYPGGPWAGSADGVVPFAAGDQYEVQVANDRGGVADGRATFQTLFERLYRLSSYQLTLPSAPVPTILDTLIA